MSVFLLAALGLPMTPEESAEFAALFDSTPLYIGPGDYR